MRLRLGINTCFAVKRWPRPEDWAPLVRDRLGLRLVQHSFDLVDTAGRADAVAAEADGLRAAVAAADLELHSTFTGLAAYSANLLLAPNPASRGAALSWFSEAIAFTARAGGIATGGHIGAFSVPDWRDPGARAARWDDLRASLLALAGLGRAAGLEYLVVENLAAAREPSTMAMIRELLTDGDAGHVPIRLCLDVGHMCVPGTSGPDRDPYAWVRALGRVAPVVQLQQSDAEGDHHWPFTRAWNAIGRIDADRVIDALGEGGVTESALILEVIPPFEADDDGVLDDLVESAGYWREALARRGVLAD
jgi:hypothetical protein